MKSNLARVRHTGCTLSQGTAWLFKQKISLSLYLIRLIVTPHRGGNYAILLSLNCNCSQVPQIFAGASVRIGSVCPEMSHVT